MIQYSSIIFNVRNTKNNLYQYNPIKKTPHIKIIFIILSPVLSLVKVLQILLMTHHIWPGVSQAQLFAPPCSQRCCALKKEEPPHT